MSNRIEALRLAVSASIGGDAVKIVESAKLFHNFLESVADMPPATASTAVTVEKKTSDTTQVTKTVDKPTATEPTPATETIDAKVARLAKDLLNKSRPKLEEALKELEVKRARDIPADKLENAAKVFEKALAA